MFMATPSKDAPTSPAVQNNGLYPPHFEEGALIQLANGEIKCVEELSMEDFQRSTELSDDLKLCISTVVKITILQERALALLCFSVGNEKLQITVEAPVEHPFLVYEKGWSSVNPQMSFKRYKLNCKELIVGDVCASLMLKPNTLESSPRVLHSYENPAADNSVVTEGR